MPLHLHFDRRDLERRIDQFQFVLFRVHLRMAPMTGQHTLCAGHELEAHAKRSAYEFDSPDVATMLEKPLIVGRYTPVSQIYANVPQAFVLLKAHAPSDL